MKPAEKYRVWKAHRPEKPIFRTILFSMMAVLLAEVILLSTGIGLTNVSGRLNQNAKQIVNMQVRNRASYLQDMLIKAEAIRCIRVQSLINEEFGFQPDLAEATGRNHFAGHDGPEQRGR